MRTYLTTLAGCIAGLLAAGPAMASDLESGVQSTYAWRQTPSEGGFTQQGTARFTFAGVRAQPFAPFRADAGVDGLFFAVDVATIRMVGANQVMLDSGVGYTFALASDVGVGPVVGYHRVLDAHHVFDRLTNDFLSLSVNLVVAR